MPEDAVAAIQRAARSVAPAELFAAAREEGVTVPGRRLGNAPLIEVYPDGDALFEAIMRGEQGAIAAAMRGLARLDGELIVEPALAFAHEGRGELRRAGTFALSRSQHDDALALLLSALDAGSQVPRGALDRSVHPAATARVRAALVGSGLTVFAVRPRPTLAEWHALGRDEQHALEAQQPTTAYSPELQRAANAISVLGARGDVDSVDLMVRIFSSHPDDRLRLRCAHALSAIDHPRAHAALDARWADADATIATIAVRAAAVRDIAGAWARFSPHLEPVLAGTSSPSDEAIVATLLYVLHGGVDPRKIAPDLDPLVIEPRFVEVAARLLRHRHVDEAARMVLEVVPRELALAAIARHPRPDVREAPLALPARRDFLARYEAGEHGVWDTLLELAPVIAQHAELRAEALAVAIALMRRVRHNTDAVRATLRAAGAQVGSDEPPATAAQLARLTAVLGPLPVALEAFYRVVGSIALHPAGRDRYDYGEHALAHEGISLVALDPLEVAGSDLVRLLEEHQARIAASHADIVGPLVVDLAPDFLHKQDISGGAPYAIHLPPRTHADAVDPRVLNQRHRTTFVRYLRIAFAWGGFPGLEVAGQRFEDIDLNDRMPFRNVKGPWGPAAERVRAQLRRDLIEF